MFSTTGKSKRPTPRLESLESREVLASSINAAGDLVIQGTNTPDHVKVSSVNSNGTNFYRIDITSNGRAAVEWQKAANVRTGIVRFNGFNGNDSFIENTGFLGVVADGGADNDWLKGGAGTDVLNGGGGNDVLYGGAGRDTLNGNDGDDFLDGEQGGAVLNGGRGLDCAADQVFINGVSRDDIRQGGTGSCFYLSALGAIGSRAGLSGFITYNGGGSYNVAVHSGTA